MWYVLEMSLCKDFTPEHSGYYAALYPDYLCVDIKNATRFDKLGIDDMLSEDIPTFDDGLWYKRGKKVT